MPTSIREGNKKAGSKFGVRSIPKDKTQINVNVKNEILAKIRTIGDTEGVTYAEIYNLAFEKFVQLYEKKNGKIKAKVKGKGLEGI